MIIHYLLVKLGDIGMLLELLVKGNFSEWCNAFKSFSIKIAAKMNLIDKH